MKHKVKMVRAPGNNRLEIYLDGSRLTPELSQKIWNHSPDGFNAGYPGSGPAQTALAILLKVANKHDAVRHHQSFKFVHLTDPVYLNEGTHEFEFDWPDYGVRK